MNIFHKLLTSLLFYIFIPATLSVAQEIFEPATTLPAARATRTGEAIAIDGTLNERAWSYADTITGFVQVEPQQGMPARNRTVVKVLYDDKYLYVGVFCFDSLGRKAMRAPDMKRDFEWRSHDTFAVCIDGFHDRRNSASFATNPLGAQKDYLSFDDALFDSDWNGLWTVRTTITDAGWFAEFRIPFKTIRYPKLAGDLRTWGINFLRLRRASNEISVWAPYPRAFGFNRMPYAGELQHIQPPPPSPNIQLNPYALVAASRQHHAGGATTETHHYKAGGDLKWAINSNTIADLTVNTDFAQADADVQVNNVTRFSVLFPEKRQFFLENASLLGPGLMAGATGGNMQLLPFFSRRIGLSDAGDPLPLHAGVRLASRSVKQNFGVLAARQGSGRGLPAADFAVARYARNVGEQNRFGVIGTLKSAGGHTNVVAGADGFVRFNASQSLNIMALHAHNSNGQGSGFGGYAQYYYTTNAVTAWLTETVLTKNFNPQTGFVSRTNVIATTPGAIANLRGKYLPFQKYIRSFQPSAIASWYHQASTGTLVEREVRIAPFRLDMQDGGYYEFAVSDTYQNLLAEFAPLGVPIAAGQYRYRRCAMLAGSDPSRKISYTLQYDFGHYYNGRLQTADVSVSLVPIPYVSLKGSVNANRLRSVGELRQSANVVLYTVQARLAVNPRLQLTGLYQHRSTQGLDSYNIRLAWEYKPLSYVYVVLNSRELPATEATRQREQQGIVKVSYLRQF